MKIIISLMLLFLGGFLEFKFADNIRSFDKEKDDWFIPYLIAQFSTFAFYFAFEILIN